MTTDQQVLEQAAGEIWSAIQQGDPRNFTSLSIDRHRPATVLCWKGPVPEALAPTLDTVRSRGIGVMVLDAVCSRAELKQFSRALMAEEQARGVPEEFRALTVACANDGSGLEIGVKRRNPEVERARSKYPISKTEENGGAVPL